jgi:hypothetical protein
MESKQNEAQHKSNWDYSVSLRRGRGARRPEYAMAREYIIGIQMGWVGSKNAKRVEMCWYKENDMSWCWCLFVMCVVGCGGNM